MPLKRSIGEVRVVLQSAIGRLRELAAGFVMPTRGGCVCDPVAWERDARVRMAEHNDAGGKGKF